MHPICQAPAIKLRLYTQGDDTGEVKAASYNLECEGDENHEGPHHMWHRFNFKVTKLTWE